MSYWIITESGELLNLANITRIKIYTEGIFKKKYNLFADDNLIMEFKHSEDAHHSMNCLHEMICGVSNNNDWDFRLNRGIVK